MPLSNEQKTFLLHIDNVVASIRRVNWAAKANQMERDFNRIFRDPKIAAKIADSRRAHARHLAEIMDRPFTR